MCSNWSVHYFTDWLLRVSSLHSYNDLCGLNSVWKATHKTKAVLCQSLSFATVTVNARLSYQSGIGLVYTSVLFYPQKVSIFRSEEG
uniref:Uncharacterized protein n=1 Tax=Pyxicephalus adspersus TaxID=30357 RepID=A0AAV3ATA2_PYXAD|nr:TPA: hypothetical protein GDO54_008178 [Pyxicephalus adspersus]